MILVNFTAARNLTGIHEEGDSVALSFSTTELVPSRKVSREVQKSIGGHRETLLYHSLRVWTVTTEPLTGADLESLMEFLDSVEGGETFDLEPWRDEEGPSLALDFLLPRLQVAEAVTCKMDSEGYSLSMLICDGTGPANAEYQVSFTAEEVPT